MNHALPLQSYRFRKSRRRINRIHQVDHRIQGARQIGVDHPRYQFHQAAVTAVREAFDVRIVSEQTELLHGVQRAPDDDQLRLQLLLDEMTAAREQLRQRRIGAVLMATAGGEADPERSGRGIAGRIGRHMTESGVRTGNIAPARLYHTAMQEKPCKSYVR